MPVENVQRASPPTTHAGARSAKLRPSNGSRPGRPPAATTPPRPRVHSSRRGAPVPRGVGGRGRALMAACDSGLQSRGSAGGTSGGSCTANSVSTAAPRRRLIVARATAARPAASMARCRISARCTCSDSTSAVETVPASRRRSARVTSSAAALAAASAAARLIPRSAPVRRRLPPAPPAPGPAVAHRLGDGLLPLAGHQHPIRCGLRRIAAAPPRRRRGKNRSGRDGSRASMAKLPCENLRADRSELKTNTGAFPRCQLRRPSPAGRSGTGPDPRAQRLRRHPLPLPEGAGVLPYRLVTATSNVKTSCAAAGLATASAATAPITAVARLIAPERCGRQPNW